MVLRSGLYAKVRLLCYSFSVRLIGLYSGHEEERRFALSYTSRAPSARHLGCKRTCGNVGVGARAYRLGFGPAQDDCDIQEHRGGMPILACMMFSQTLHIHLVRSANSLVKPVEMLGHTTSTDSDFKVSCGCWLRSTLR